MNTESRLNIDNTGDITTYTLNNYEDDIDATWAYDNLMGIRPINSNMNCKRVKNRKCKRKMQRKARRRNR